MTIHKSKGLEFETVIMPFVNWDLEDSRHQSILWCEDPYNKLDYIPVQFSKSLLESAFANAYLDEHLHSYVDNLNLLYVAFTRACSGLYCYGTSPGKNLKNVADLLYLTTSNPDILRQFFKISGNDSIESIWENDQLTIGKLPPRFAHITEKQCITPEFSTWPLPVMQSWGYAERVAIFLDSDGFMNADKRMQVNKGKMMHRLFEMIQSRKDVPNAVQQVVLEGLIAENDKENLKQQVYQMIDDDLVKDWFNDKVEVMNERSLLSKRGNYRPDRVMLDGNVLKIVDYKFGEVHSSLHERQVSNYMNLAAQMKYAKVEGYIWYVSENKVVRVSPSHPALF